MLEDNLSSGQLWSGKPSLSNNTVYIVEREPLDFDSDPVSVYTRILSEYGSGHPSGIISISSNREVRSLYCERNFIGSSEINLTNGKSLDLKTLDNSDYFFKEIKDARLLLSGDKEFNIIVEDLFKRRQVNSKEKPYNFERLEFETFHS